MFPRSPQREKRDFITWSWVTFSRRCTVRMRSALFAQFALPEIWYGPRGDGGGRGAQRMTRRDLRHLRLRC